MRTAAMHLTALVLLALVFYGSYWLAKHGSYAIWYEDMVKATVREMVREEALQPDRR